MKQLNSLQTQIFKLGCILMVVGVAVNFFGLIRVAPWIFLVGALCFAAMQYVQVYNGNNFVIRRLRRIMLISDFLIVISGLLMVENIFHFTLPLFQQYGLDGMRAYNQYVIHNNWVVTMLIAAVLQIYTMHRLSNELEKDNSNNSQ